MALKDAVFQILRCAPVGDEWARFDAYARRVRHLSLPWDHSALAQQLLEMLILRGQDVCFFPNLHSLICHARPDSWYPFAQVFIPAGIKNFTLWLSKPLQLNIDIMNFLSRHCPGLLRLEIENLEEDMQYWSLPPSLNSTISNFVLHANALIGIKGYTTNLDDQAVVQLCRLPNLRHFALRETVLDHIVDAFGISEAGKSEQAYFPQLVLLQAAIVDPTKLPIILANMATRTLHTLDVLLKSLCTSTSLHDIFSVLRPQVRLSNLRIWFPEGGYAPTSSSANEGRYWIRLETIEPLLALSTMERFEIFSPYLVPEDELLRKIGQHWPHLRALCLDNQNMPLDRLVDNPSSVTMDGIVALQNACPYLQHVMIMLQTSSVRTWTEIASRNPVCQRFYFLNSPLVSKDVRALAIALHRRNIWMIPHDFEPAISALARVNAHAWLHAPEVDPVHAMEDRAACWRQVAHRMARIEFDEDSSSSDES
jgi:hypothetical protein